MRADLLRISARYADAGGPLPAGPATPTFDARKLTGRAIREQDRLRSESMPPRATSRPALRTATRSTGAARRSRPLRRDRHQPVDTCGDCPPTSLRRPLTARRSEAPLLRVTSASLLETLDLPHIRAARPRPRRAIVNSSTSNAASNSSDRTRARSWPLSVRRRRRPARFATAGRRPANDNRMSSSGRGSLLARWREALFWLAFEMPKLCCYCSPDWSI